MEETTRLDEVTIFDGKLSFLILHGWDETAEEGHYLYSHRGADSGCFRVSLNTVKAVGETSAQLLKRLFEGRKNVTHDASTGNWVSTMNETPKKKARRFTLAPLCRPSES